MRAKRASKDDGKTSMPFEILHRAFVLLGGGAGSEGAEIAAAAGLGIYFSRVEPVLAGRQFADHGVASAAHRRPTLTARAVIINSAKADLFSRRDLPASDVKQR
jgi:alkanesulfonate monooxygenase SsuD/methylene tetrahydromethanopterin reductase-like flavin-dependent oxidoreductase (luciferase family)